MRSALTSTEAESVRLKTPWEAERICVWDKEGRLANPGRKFQVPQAGQRVEVENNPVSKEFHTLIWG